MKKLLLAALLAIVSVGASAQIERGMRYGAQGFIGINSIGEDGIKSALSFGGGFIAEYNFSEKAYLASGLNLQNKGWKSELFGKATKVLYLTLPIHLGGRVAVGGNSHLHFQGGPQLAYGLAGSRLTIGDLSDTYAGWGKRFELGAGAKVGVEFNKLQVNLTGNYGFTHCLGDYGHNLDFTLGVAYMF